MNIGTHKPMLKNKGLKCMSHSRRAIRLLFLVNLLLCQRALGNSIQEPTGDSWFVTTITLEPEKPIQGLAIVTERDPYTFVELPVIHYTGELPFYLLGPALPGEGNNAADASRKWISGVQEATRNHGAGFLAKHLLQLKGNEYEMSFFLRNQIQSFLEFKFQNGRVLSPECLSCESPRWREEKSTYTYHGIGSRFSWGVEVKYEDHRPADVRIPASKEDIGAIGFLNGKIIYFKRRISYSLNQNYDPFKKEKMQAQLKASLLSRPRSRSNFRMPTIRQVSIGALSLLALGLLFSSFRFSRIRAKNIAKK